jgi:hypothetical protein
MFLVRFANVELIQMLLFSVSDEPLPPLHAESSSVHRNGLGAGHLL